ncbi:unnamed protein product (macronuclear) [Paramecium tetraurelia]|uniref:Chromosome undetermined scaffold_1, whole genome shotgun sequence n=1 Tax=Paramecium tetraurelia TaxID=5888 RepID=Q6BGF8_PARTE|nr:UNC51-like kinase [Paramecium tetraurelia strain d4-2]XP_001423445.1 uncharacterized protein GSPATT00000482001 [Paramecium tetraurelia]CAH03262.1 UNC51-like kinase, putative [Paramecium tetraurelia]CAK56047.1 unnamed protein product [Paramecium tetraurelia]|eukprot:XP_001423445.1 hypothetical protein (macronuclear) [Paramecium tetraurelia strain d4-2]
MKKRIKRLQGSSYVISLEPDDVLGQGSFGKVVRAYDLENREEQLVAKIMEIGTQSKLDSLQHELTVLEQFQSDHQNLVQYKRKKLQSTKACYIIMEYCNGGTLEDKMKNKFWSEAEVMDFLGQFCSGYRELFLQNIIHRDLKPANIMLHDRLYKITDFGLAKIVNTLVDKLTISFKGTPLYMAPEMIQEEATADPKIDMWGLGIILYRMLYNKYPFLIQNKKYDRDTAFSDIINNNLIIPPTPKRSDFMIYLLQKMLKKQSKDRIGWEELFQLPQIKIQSQSQVDQNNQMISSSLFIQQMVIQKVSLIKVQPFKEKKVLSLVSQILTEEDLKKQTEDQEKEQKIILNEMMSNLNHKLQIQLKINQIEDILFYFHEQIFFLDKAAMRVYRLNQVIPNIDFNITFNITAVILNQALGLIKKLQKLQQLDPQQVNLYKTTENYQIFQSLLQQDILGLEDFYKEVKNKVVTNIKNPIDQLFNLIQNQKPINSIIQVYITIKYLKDSQHLDELNFSIMEDFWTYYENVENTSEQEASQYFEKQLI